MKQKKPTEAELQILKVLWENGPQTVRNVNEEISKTNDVGYTTTLKIMQIMTEKQMLSRDTSNRTHIYKTKIDRVDTQKYLLSSLMDVAFQGSTSSLVLHALGNHTPSTEELSEIKALIEKLENQTK